MKEIKRLTSIDHQDFININKAIRENIANPDWFMPFSEEDLQNTFDSDSTLVIYGAFIDNTLGAVSLFDTDKNEFCELANACGVSADKGAELGGSMVLPSFRGQNLMYEINAKLIEVAKEMGLEYFVATVHPDNIASNSSVKKLGMKYVTTITRAGGYLRNVYILKFN